MNTKYYNSFLRTGLLCLLVMTTVACQNQKQKKYPSMTKNDVVKPPSEELLRNQREIDELQQCKDQLNALHTINKEQYQHYKQVFDGLMSGAAQYASMRANVSGNTQETVDALYRYKVNFLCAEMNQAVLIELAKRGEQVK